MSFYGVNIPSASDKGSFGKGVLSKMSMFLEILENLEILQRTLAHRNRSDFCDLRLRCPSRTPKIARFPKQETAMMHCDLRVRWKVASDLRFRAAISEPKTLSCCGISGDLAPSTRKSLAIAIVRFWCAKQRTQSVENNGPPFFAHPFFLFLLCPPRPSPGKFLPKIPSFWDLRSTLSSRERATCRGWVWGTVLDGVAPQEKKEIPFFLAREKR